MKDIFTAKWLECVSEEGRSALKDSCKKLSLRNRDILYRQGEKQVWLWGLVSGQIRVHVALTKEEPVMGHIHQPGAWFGEAEPLLDSPGLSEMQAAGDIELVRIEYSRFRELAMTYPEMWEALAQLAAIHQFMAATVANDLTLRTGEARLAAILLRLSGQRMAIENNTPLDTVPASQQEIANLANVSLSKASDQLGRFSRKGLIELEYGRIKVLDPIELLKLTED